MSVYNQLPDKDIVKKVNKAFYDKVYKHPWMKLYFEHVPQEHIERQQTDFIIGALGGPKNYSGRMPKDAHPHMQITNELYDLREKLLTEALDEVKAPIILKEAWLTIDEALRKVILRPNVSDLKPRYATDNYLIFENPEKVKKAA